MNVTRKNHFVPQAYLNRWADASGAVHRYRLLVSHRNVPLWDESRVRGLAQRRDLYTVVEGQVASDEFERWFEREYETPAQDAIEKAANDVRLRRADWERLILYCLVQDLRTPRTYHELTSRVAASFNAMAAGLLKEAKRAAERGVEPSDTQGLRHAGYDSIQGAIRVTVDPDAHPDRDEGEVTVKMLAGRRLWLNEIQRLATGKLRDAALRHEWSIVEPADGMKWVTSDHPVVRLNYHGDDGTYDLKGGWGRRHGNIFMPLSPRHLLFTQIGSTQTRRRLSFPPGVTSLIRKTLVENALDDVFAGERDRQVVVWRPRVVDAGAYSERENAWANWDEAQNRAEQDFREG